MTIDFAEWLNLALRWLHLITGIAWIGASFYFVWLDNHLVPPASGDASGAVGWAQVEPLLGKHCQSGQAAVVIAMGDCGGVGCAGGGLAGL